MCYTFVATPRKLGDLIGVNIPVRVSISAALAVLAMALSGVYIFFPNAHDAVTVIALALTAVATIGGTFYVSETLRSQGALEQARADEQKQAREADKADKRRGEAFAKPS